MLAYQPNLLSKGKADTATRDRLWRGFRETQICSFHGRLELEFHAWDTAFAEGRNLRLEEAVTFVTLLG